MSGQLFDISPAIDPRLRVWPGDTEPSREVLLDIARGDHLTLSTLHTTVHAGAHADAPSHYGKDAPTIDRQPLELYVGRCRVVRAEATRGARVSADAIGLDLDRPLDEPRILIATGTYPDPTVFDESFSGLEPELVDRLADAGAKLVGVDTPSVDAFDSTDLPTHATCLSREVAILEGLVLKGIPEGVYELIALPLRLVGFDASPVRAVLRSI